MEKYNIMVNGIQQGPFTKQEILSKGFSKDSYVYSKFLGCWKMMSELPEFTYLQQEEEKISEPPVFTETRELTDNTGSYGPKTSTSPEVPGYSHPTNIEYADWGSRLVAFLIDFVFVLVIFVIVIVIIAGMVIITGMVNKNSLDEEMVGYLVFYIIMMFYYAGFESGSKQGTWGKQIVGLKVADASTNAPVSYGQAMGRFFSRLILGFIPLVNLLDYLAPFWTDKKQTWHDKWSSCVVIEK